MLPWEHVLIATSAVKEAGTGMTALLQAYCPGERCWR